MKLRKYIESKNKKEGEKFITETKEYKIQITPTHYQNLKDAVTNNVPLQLENLGLMIGKAKPVIVRVRCALCDRNIKGKDLYENGDMTDPFGLHFGKHVHKACYEEAVKIVEEEKAKSNPVQEGGEQNAEEDGNTSTEA